jgi:adenylate cyclase
VRRTLHEEAQRNELRLAYVRCVLLGLHTALAWTLDWIIAPDALPNAWIEDVVYLCLFALSGVVLLGLRRGYYREGAPLVMPVFDGSMILLAFSLAIHLHGAAVFAEYEIRATLGLTTAILVISGAARLHPGLAYFATALAVGIYVTVSGLVGWKQIDLLAIAMLGSLGYFGAWMTGLVRRVAEGEVARGTLRRFLPDTVIDQAHHDPLAILSTPRSLQATILVTDIRGFTSFAEGNESHRVFEVLNEIQGTLAEIVVRNEGTVDKFTGDGMLAIFGLSNGLDHANNALRAVRQMRGAIEDLRISSAVSSDLDVRLGIALHSGNVLVGCIGSGARLEFTTIGDAVNTTFRLQDLTKGFSVDVLVSEDTVKLADATSYRFDSLGTTEVRGRVQRLEVFALKEGGDAVAAAC